MRIVKYNACYETRGVLACSTTPHELQEVKPTQSEKNEAQQQAKKAYATPKLTVHGNVEKITENVQAKASDGVAGSRLADLTAG